MSKVRPVNTAIAEALTAEETTQMADMQKADALPDTSGDAPIAPPAPAPAPVPKADAPKPGDKVDGAPAPKTGDKAEGDKEGAKGGPLSPEATAALREERAEKKALKEALAKADETNKLLTDRFEKVLANFAPKKEDPKPEVIPDFETDPAGWIAGTMKQTGKSIEEVQAFIAEQKRDKANQAEIDKGVGVINDIMGYAITQEKAFIAQTPDYNDASIFLLQSRKDELSDLGYNDAQCQEIINNERLAIASQCKQNGTNPAEAVYKIAKRRGYALKAPEGDKKDPPPPVVPAEPDAAAKLAAAREGRESGSSLSDVSGVAPAALTVASLLAMPEAEFDKWMQTKEGKALMGQ